MRLQRLLIALTILNFGLLVFLLMQVQPAQARAAAGVLRGRELQIVDDHDRVRARIEVLPAVPPSRSPDGKAYAESVMLRLIDSEGRPGVKLGASVEGAGLGLGGDKDPTYISLIAQGDHTSIKLTDNDGKQQLLKP